MYQIDVKKHRQNGLKTIADDFLNPQKMDAIRKMIRHHLKFLSVFLLIVTLIAVYKIIEFKQSPNISLDYSIGDFVEFELTSGKFTGENPASGSFFVADKKLLGWPKAPGIFTFSTTKGDVVLKVSSKISETITTEDSSYSILWDNINLNKVIRRTEGGQLVTVSDSSSVKWQLHTTELSNFLTWLDFPQRGGKDQVILKDMSNGNETAFAAEDTLHRKPQLSNKYLYWYQETFDATSDREICIFRVKLDQLTISEVVICSSYPNIITDYIVLGNDEIVATRKNYDGQSTDIVRIDELGNVSISENIDVFVQNLHSHGTSFAYEKKPHNGFWRVTEIDQTLGETRTHFDSERSVLIEGYKDGELLTKTIDSFKFLTTYNELLDRYSPPHIGLSRYDNTFGTLSISEAAIMRSLITVAQSQEDYYYWHIAAERAREIVKRTNNKSGITDWTGAAGANFSIKAFSNENKYYVSYLVHDSSIVDVLLLLAQKVSTDEYLRFIYPELVDDIFAVSSDILEYYTSQAIWKEADPYNIIEDGEAYFVFQPGSPYKYDGVNLPFNMMNSFVRPLQLFSRIYDEESHKNLAIALGNLFKRHLIYRSDTNSYVWPYWWGLYSKGWNISSISVNTPHSQKQQGIDVADADHASLDIRAMGSMARELKVFSQKDLDRIANTAELNFDRVDHKSSLLIDGRIQSANYNSIEYLWGEAASFNVPVLARFKNRIKDFPYVQDAYTATARYELVGLSFAIAGE